MNQVINKLEFKSKVSVFLILMACIVCSQASANTKLCSDSPQFKSSDNSIYSKNIDTYSSIALNYDSYPIKEGSALQVPYIPFYNVKFSSNFTARGPPSV